jgi:hypothetical protein
MRATLAVAALAVALVTPAFGSNAASRTSRPARYAPTRAEAAFLDTLERRTFAWFWDVADPRTGQTPDRWPTKTFTSVSATGFALTAYPIGVERRWVSRAAARARVLATLRFFAASRQDTSAHDATGHRGFYYHFLTYDGATRFKDVELSTIDTALLFGGVLFCQSYFDRANAEEAEIRALADTLVERADWRWAEVRPHLIAHGWDPERGFLPYDWAGMNESMIVPILALGSRTHPVDPEVWPTWERSCVWGSFEGYEHVGFAPLFGHQYSQIWLDLRGLRDSLMAAHGIDWFENSRRATLAQRAYAIQNPAGFVGYGPRLWGMTACDGPADGTRTLGGVARELHTYWARGASFRVVRDDGTIAPAAAAGSVPFAPEVAIPVLRAMRDDWGAHAWNRYGFVDAFNPTVREPVDVAAGAVVSGVGWFDVDQLGIDQGPLLAMIENYRSGLVWRVMRRNPTVVRGLRCAGFHGGWLDAASGSR